MDGGLLSLRWNDHSQTFFSMLSAVRKREVYCDVTLACDGRFYPVHKLVLSTCSDFFDQMFERTTCRHPVIVMANVAHRDLEALLNYMYLGEVNVLQTELSALMNAAEALRIKGLAEPGREGKRPWDGGLPDSKRKKSEEAGRGRRPSGEGVTNGESGEPKVPPSGRESSSGGSADRTTEPSRSRPETGPSTQDDSGYGPTDKALRPEVKMEEVSVKEEPTGWFSETEGLENFQYNEAVDYRSEPATYQAGCLPWEVASAQTLDTHLSQGIPGPSRMQGVEEDGRRNRRECVRWTPEQRLQIHRACCEMGPSKAAREMSRRFGRKLNESTVRSIQKSYVLRR